MARRSLLLLGLAACACAAFARTALADDPVALAAEHKVVEEDDFTTRRYEPALLPIIAGDSDIGVEFGAAATLSLFGDGIVPYRWNMDLVAAVSLKGVPGGVEMAQQSYLWTSTSPHWRAASFA